MVVYLTNTQTIFLRLVYIPVHPGFIDILSFESQCHPSNAPEKVEEGIIVVDPRFQGERKPTLSRPSPELFLLVLAPNVHAPPHDRWSRIGVAGRGMSVAPVSKRVCLPV